MDLVAFNSKPFLSTNADFGGNSDFSKNSSLLYALFITNKLKNKAR